MGMNTNIWVVQISMVVFVATVVAPSFAATYYVGDANGWQTPGIGILSFNYTNWASSKTFYAGDILVFNFATGQHTAASVAQNDYAICNTTTPLAIETTGPASHTLAAGPSYFICTVTGHCQQGQKMAVNALATPPPPPPNSLPGFPALPTPPSSFQGSPPPPPPPPPPPRSSAAAVAIVASSLMFLPILMTTFL